MRFQLQFRLTLSALCLVACAQQPVQSGLSTASDTDRAASRYGDPDDIILMQAAALPLPVVRAFPRYPTDLESTGISGAVVVAYVIDTTGRVESSSVSLLQATHREFAEAVCRYLPKVRYEPFLAEGRKVRVLVVQANDFIAPGGSRDSPESAEASRVQSHAEEEFKKIPMTTIVNALDRLPHCSVR